MMNAKGFALRTMLSAAAALSAAGAASAADLAMPETIVETAPSPIDVAFGVKFTNDYVFRGITQTRGDFSVQGYSEIRLYDWVYAGVWASNVSFPLSFGLSDPSAEVDLYGGIRHTWDAFTLDVGGLYYYYPGEHGPAPETDYWEIYAKPSYAFGEFGSVTGNVFWTSDFLNTGADATYLSVIGKANLPNVTGVDGLSFYVSGEFGKQWIGRTTAFGVADFNPFDYLTWNAGVGVTYKAITLDFRYSDSDLSKNECAFNTLGRNFCGDRYMVSLSFDTTLSALK